MRHAQPLAEQRAAVTPTAGTMASTPPTSDPQIGIPSMRTATTSTQNAIDGGVASTGQAPGQEPAEQEGGAGELAVGEVAHPREPPADRRRVAEHGVQLERRADEHVDHEEAEHRRPGRGAAGRGAAPARSTVARTPTAIATANTKSQYAPVRRASWKSMSRAR